MDAIKFDKATANLTPLCAQLDGMDEDARTQLEYEVGRLRNRKDLSEQTRKYIFGLLLVRTFGTETVLRSISAIRDDIAVTTSGAVARDGAPGEAVDEVAQGEAGERDST